MEKVEFSVDKIRFVHDGRARQRGAYSVQNKGGASLKVRVALTKGSDQVFSLLAGVEERYLAAGLKLPVVLQYSPSQAGSGEGAGHVGELLVFVDGGLVTSVAIEGVPPSPNLEVTPRLVEFGAVVCEHQLVARSFTLRNTGSRLGGFRLDVSSMPQQFRVHPTNGRVAPAQEIEVKVEMLCSEIGSFSEVLRVLPCEMNDPDRPKVEDVLPDRPLLEGVLPDRPLLEEGVLPDRPLLEEVMLPDRPLLEGVLPDRPLLEEGVLPDRPLLEVCLAGEVVQRRLCLLHPATQCELQRLSFGDVYYHTTHTQTAMLYNYSPESSHYLVLLDDQAPGSMVGWDGSEGLATCSGGGLARGREQGDSPHCSSLLHVNPHQGCLAPYERKLVEVTFAPQFQQGGRGWEHREAPPTQRDYALFLKFILVDTHSSTSPGLARSPDPLELAVTGCARPVLLRVEPGNTLTFDPCPTGKSASKQLQLINCSEVLSVDFQCRQPAHYKCVPSSARLSPGASVHLSVSFLPRQLGPLNSKLHIDIIGTRAHNTTGGKKEVISSIPLELKGEGVTIRTAVREAGPVLAQPNDLASSIRPHDGQSTILTPFTRVPRRTYVDPDYSLSRAEAAAQHAHRDGYTHYLRGRAGSREWRRRERDLSEPAFRTATDLSIAPSQGLQPPHLATPPPAAAAAAEEDGGGGGERRIAKPLLASQATSRGGGGAKMLTARDLSNSTAIELEYVEQCRHRPAGSEAAQECRSQLTPEQLSKVCIEPRVLDFGSVVVGTGAEQCISARNYLNRHIAILIKCVDAELCVSSSGAGQPGPSPSSPGGEVGVVLPPLSQTSLRCSLRPKHTGIVERSLEYVVNGCHGAHLPVRACVTRLSVALSAPSLPLTQPPLATPTAGLRGSVVVSNRHTVPAPFLWRPAEGVDLTTFSMMCPAGVVPPGGRLECEFLCQPYYDCPASAHFTLTVEGEGGDPGHQQLTLLTQFSRPECCFKEKRVLFGAVPLNLPTTHCVHLQNNGTCHAYFKVADTQAPVGLKVFPESGCVPVGGATELRLVVHPETVGHFEGRVCVRLREGRPLSLKLAGTVEQPCVSIDQELFRFGGVYTGATASLPFTACNKASTRSQLTFDLSYLTDFSLVLPQNSEQHDEWYSKEQKEEEEVEGPGRGVRRLELPGRSSANCTLNFCPQNVAAYDFSLPVLVNGLHPPSPPPSPWPPSLTHSKVTVSSLHHPHTSTPSLETTPTRRVLATGLRAPLLVSTTRLHFSLEAGQLETLSGPLKHDKVIELSNMGEETLSWALETAALKRLQDGTFQFTFLPGSPPLAPPTPGCPVSSGGSLPPGARSSFTVNCLPPHHGEFSASVPLVVNSNSAQPYRTLQLSAVVATGRISVSPSHIVVQPVPLGVSLTAQFVVAVEGFAGAVQLEATCPPVEEHVSFSVHFPAGCTVTECCQRRVELCCRLEFSACQPVSWTDCVTFTDTVTGRRKRVPFTVAADNSLFTIYEFLAQNLTSSAIRPDSKQVPTIVLQAQRPIVSRLGSLSGSAQSLAGGGLATRSLATLSEEAVGSSSTFGNIFLQDCISSLCRWLSVHGWAESVKSVATPTDLRTRVGHTVAKTRVKQRSNISTSRGVLVDLLTHLCGRVPPGIPLNPPPCTTAIEKVNQLYSTYTTVLAFIKNQGGVLWSVLPEALLHQADYQLWEAEVGHTADGFRPLGNEEFNELSQQAWTHLLMQVVKVLVLPKVLSRVPRPLRETAEGLAPLESNVYSQAERLLLAWLNLHVTQQRSAVFKQQQQDCKPVCPHVINFDVNLMDCSALACVLAAYCPFLNHTHFTKLYMEPATPEQCSHNAVILVDALRYIGLEYDVLPTDITSPNPIAMILLCAYLYQRLPAYRPKKTITFEGTLNSTVLQKVQLEGPSGRSLDYQALLRGDGRKEFTLQDDLHTVTLAAGRPAPVGVAFTARRVAQCSALLLLVARGQRSVGGATLAFKLQGVVTGAKSQATTSVTAALYERQTISCPVASPFPQAGLFTVQLCEFSDQTSSPRPRKKPGARPSAAIIPASALQNRSGDSMRVFHCATSSLPLSPDQPSSLPIDFTPLKMEQRHCAVLLSCEELGQIVVSITATVKLPRPILPHSPLISKHSVIDTQSRALHLKVHAGQEIKEELVITSTNPALEQALLDVSIWGMDETELRRRFLSESLRFAALTTAIETLDLDPHPNTRNQKTDSNDELVFSVTGSNEYFTLPDEISIPTVGSSSAVLPVSLHCEKEGHLECHIVLRCKHDLRMLVIEATVLARGRHAELELRTPAMQPLTQDIPLVNPSTVDWPLVASVVGGACFSGPAHIIARALSTACYPLTFDPRREGTVEGELRLHNSTDGSEHVFQLRGVAERPLAQEHITLHTQAKTSVQRLLHVPNHNERSTEFRVESDLDFIAGPSIISIGGGDVVDYPLTVLPLRQGLFSGAVAFVAQSTNEPHSATLESAVTSRGSPQHVWFQLECIVDPAPPDHVIPVSCATLSSVSVQLNIVNTHPQTLKLQISLEGEGLAGAASLEVGASSEAVYPLTFSPTLTGRSQGRVVFNGSPDGEFWYQLNLSALDPQPTTLPTLSCQLGRSCEQSVLLTNPLPEEVWFTCHNPNTRHFVVQGLAEGGLALGPGSSLEVPVVFRPSALGLGEHCTQITFSSTQFGARVFNLNGQGQPPTSMDPTTITASLSSNTVHIIAFNNPLDSPTQFSVSLRGSDLEHFCLLMKRMTSILLHPSASLDIPVMFAPEAMHKHQVEVVITAAVEKLAKTEVEGSGECDESEALFWVYPVCGQPELQATSSTKLQCAAKDRLEQNLEVTLVYSLAKSGVKVCTDLVERNDDQIKQPCSLDEESYSYELVSNEQGLSSLVQQSVGLKLVEKREESREVTLVFSVVFAPPKAFSCVCDLQVLGSRGGVWLFALHLAASGASPDDVIAIEAVALNREASVSFRLSSMSDHPVPFTARLTASHSEISVQPTTGELAPLSSDGTLFCLSYKPSSYGRERRARLIVQSECNEWCYEVIGKPPGYTPPCHALARVQHKQPSPLLTLSPATGGGGGGGGGKRNFIRGNMKNVSVSS